MTKPEANGPPERRRVVWPAGDPGHLREQWCKDCCAYARLRRRPVVVSLVIAIERYLHRDDGYAWPTNEALAGDMGQRNVSSITRALDIAERELGIIERVTRPVIGEGGRITTMRREIFPTRPDGMMDALDDNRRKRLPSAEYRTKIHSKSDGYGTFGRRREDGVTVCRMPNEPSAEPSAEPLGQDTGLSLPSRGKRTEEPSADFSDFGEAARAVASRSLLLAELVERLSFIGPSDLSTEDTARGLIEIGRCVYSATKRGGLDRRDASTAVEHVRDASVRAWVDHSPDVQRMLTHLRQLETAWTSPT